MSECTVCVYPHRIRIRGAALGDNAIVKRIEDAMSRLDDGIEVEKGSGSIAVLLPDGLDRQKIVDALKNELPDGASRAASVFSKIHIDRKAWLYSLFTAGVTTVALAAFGCHKAHMWAGGAFALLATHHVWERRKRLF